MRWNKPRVPRRVPTYWNQWFAWRPVKIEDTGETVWLEWIWRHVEVTEGGMLDRVVTSIRYRSDVHEAGANLKHY